MKWLGKTVGKRAKKKRVKREGERELRKNREGDKRRRAGNQKVKE